MTNYSSIDVAAGTVRRPTARRVSEALRCYGNRYLELLGRSDLGAEVDSGQPHRTRSANSESATVFREPTDGDG